MTYVSVLLIYYITKYFWTRNAAHTVLWKRMVSFSFFLPNHLSLMHNSLICYLPSPISTLWSATLF